METKNSNHMNETISEGIKANTKRLTEMAASMSDVYKNQLNETVNFSGKVLNSIIENNKSAWDTAQHFTNLFSTNSDWMKIMFPSDQHGANSNPVFSFYENAIRQIANYNQNLSEMLFKQSNFPAIDWKEIGENYQKTTEEQIESARETAFKLLDRYNKRAELSYETIKDVQNEFYKQTKTIIEFNQKIMAEALSKKASFVEDFIEKPLHANHNGSDKKQAKTTA